MDIEKLKAIVGEDNILTSIEERICYAYDATRHRHLPDAVIRPGSTEEVAQILTYANENGIPITPRGAGTGLSGGTVPLKGGISLVMIRMNKILEINPQDLYAVVEPGVVTFALATEVDKLGLLYPPDPASQNVSTIGGNVAENAGGLRGLKYGVTSDYIMGLEVVSPQGEIFHTGAKTVKSVAGYDLTSLFVGSEGTLGVVTKITAKLIPKPEYHRSMLAIFDDLTEAARAVAETIEAGVFPATMEIMDKITINAIEDFKQIGLPRQAEAILLIETDGIREAAEKEAEKIAAICKRRGAMSVEVAKDDEERDRLWEGRRTALSALARVKPTTILEDATVPRSKFPDLVDKVTEIAKKYNLTIGTFGHAGDGNLHPTILTDARDKEESERVEDTIREIFDTALSLGGTLSGEHGIGFTKAKFLELEVGREGLEMMRRIKKAMDPNNILNPGKIFLE